MNHSRRKNKTCFVTTPIYYPSGNLHIGHLYSTTIAWAIKNYKLKKGYDVKFLTGSDEPVSYTHLTLPTTVGPCRSRWSPYH